MLTIINIMTELCKPEEMVKVMFRSYDQSDMQWDMISTYLPINPTEEYLKVNYMTPENAKAWMEFVQDHDLKPGDEIGIYLQGNRPRQFLAKFTIKADTESRRRILKPESDRSSSHQGP